MPNNTRPHLQRNVYSQPIQTEANPSPLQRPLRGVRQDKGAHSRASVASLRPAPQEKDTRPHPLNNNLTRVQNHHSTKRKTVHLTLWVKPIVKTELARLAETEGLSVSAVGGAFLEKGMQANFDLQYGTLLTPVIEKAILKQMRAISTRLASLLVRVAFDAGQTRSLTTNILGRMPGVNPDILKTILENSSKTAKGNITRRTPQITELIEAVEQWIVTDDTETKKP